jgi:class 3 adenylate cyclase
MPRAERPTPRPDERELPTGTVTFLFTDIEGSTRLFQALGDGYRQVQADHFALMRSAINDGEGVEVKTEGDAFFVAFEAGSQAVSCAVDAQRRFTADQWPASHQLRVRMGIHTGEAAVIDGDYLGIDVNLAARIAAAAHGGQILTSAATRGMAAAGLPEGIALRPLGEHRLKDFPRPIALFQRTSGARLPRVPQLLHRGEQPDQRTQPIPWPGLGSDVAGPA